MNIAFVHIPKAAGGSIRNWLGKYSKSYQFTFKGGHSFLHELGNDSIEPFDWSFAVARNSYDRMISAYVFLDRKINSRIKRCYKQSMIAELDYWEKLNEAHKKGICYFLNHMENEPYYSRFLTSQLDWIKDVECVLQYEDLENEFKLVQKKLSCFEPLKRERHIGTYNIEEFYSDEFKKTVLKIFEEEIDFFKYLPRY